MPSDQPDVLPLDASLGYQIRATHRLFQRYLHSKIEPHGITVGMWYFLRVLWQEDGLTQRELSNRVGTMEPTTLTALRAMERSGLILRERNVADRRKINIFLTDRGRALESVLLPLARSVVDDAASSFTAAERSSVLAALKAIQANIARSVEASGR